MLLSRRIASIQDRERLIAAVERARDSWLTHAPNLDIFGRDLRSAKAVPPAEVPPDMITMNSRFAISDHGSGEVISYTLVYPEAASSRGGAVSVLSPMGMALFGARVGEEVCWLSSIGPEVATVERLLYQPEAAGHHRI